jgi:LPXTG-site transpeptidase (sortase) family protein
MRFNRTSGPLRPWKVLFQSVLILAILVTTFGVSQLENAQALGTNPVPSGNETGAPLYIPTASVSVSAPADVPLGQNVSFSVTFDNTGADPGYGPFIDVVLDRTGADGVHPGTPAPANTYDGLSTNTTITATYLGSPIQASDISVVTFDGSGNATHPLMRTASGNFETITAATYGAAPGDKLVVIRLPFGSFTPAQPAATIDVTVNMSNLADVGTPLGIWARGGYQYGEDPLDNFCCGDLAVNTVGGVASGMITPVLLTLTKAYIGPEDETATGPNFPRSYTLTADIATGVTITELDLIDVLPDNIQFISVSSVPSETVGDSTYPSTSTPGGTLPLNYDSVSSDVTVTVNFYVPQLDASSADVIDPASGDDVQSDNSVTGAGNWLPNDTRDRDTNPPFTVAVTGDCPGCPHTLTDKSIAIQKSVSGSSAPGGVLSYTLEFQVSDFFAFNDIVIADVISDGQRLSSAPVLQVNGNGYVIAAGPFDSANYDVNCYYSSTPLNEGGDQSECENVNPSNSGDPDEYGTTQLILRVSDEIAETQLNGYMVGGCVSTVGPGYGLITPCDTFGAGDGPTTGTITFQTTIMERFSDNFPSGDFSVDQGDLLENNVLIDGDVVDINTFVDTNVPEGDGSSASVTLPTGSLAKAVYAVNGSTSFSSPVEVKPGDTLTYRITYTMPISDEENLELTDYLPLPVFHVGDPDEDGAAGPAWSFDPTVSAASPAAGVAKFGPADTFFVYSALSPTVASSTSENRLIFTYGDFDDVQNISNVVDLLFTVTVSDEPFADGLYLTNQAHAFEGSTNGGLVQANAIVQIILTEPVLSNTKTVFWTDSASGAFSSPVGGGGVTILSPVNSPRWTGTISSNYLNSNPLDADISQVDAGDTVSFAIIIENSGSSLKGAFDLQLRDTLQSQFDIPSGGLNLQVFYGDGSGMIPYRGLTTNCTATTVNDSCGEELFQDGIELIDPTVTAGDCTGSWPGDPCGFDGVAGTSDDPGICQVHDPNLGNNVILITYDLQIETGVAPGDIVNTSSLLNYAGTEGGPNHLSEPLDEDATTSVDAAPVKYLVSTSEAHTTGTDVTIGEVARYRIVISIPEATTTNLQIRDLLNPGLIFLNDGTARVGFVSNGGVSSVDTGTLPIPGIPNSCFIAGSTADAGTPATLPCALDDENIGSSSSTTVNDDVYAAGVDVYFKLGDVTNTESDNNSEYAIVEFNALVHNGAANSNDDGDTLPNVARVTTTASNTLLGSDSSSLDITVREPRQTITKTVSDPNPAPGEVVTFTLVMTNTGNATAFDINIVDGIPTELTLNLGSITITPSGTVVGLSNTSIATQVNVSASSVTVGSGITITYDATVNTTLNDIFINDAETTWTSVPGPNGTLVNPTGSSAPGTAGSDTGERDDSGGQNDYSDSDDVTITVNRNLAKTLVATNVGTTVNPDVTIGEIVTYQLVLTIPANSTDTAIIVDTLDSGLAFVDCAETAPVANMHDIVAGPNISITAPNLTFAVDGHGHNVAGCSHGTTSGASNPLISTSGDVVTFDLGTVTNSDLVNSQTITITYRAIVLDSAANVQNQGVLLDNDVEWIWSTGTVDDSATPALEIVEPDMEITKTVDPAIAAIGSYVTFTIEISHTDESLTTAYDVRVIDGVPTGLALVAGSVSVTETGGPVGLDIQESPTQVTVYWSEFPLAATASISFQAIFVGPAPVFNTANVEWKSLQIDPGPPPPLVSGPSVAQSAYNALSTERRYDPADLTGVNNYLVSSTTRISTPARLPRTGFAPGRVTVLPEQSEDLAYAAMGDLWLEIPELGVNVDIVGVPYGSDEWNLTWLAGNAGYLEGTAYPTHEGNSGITAHAYMADGTPGPFAGLEALGYGDQIIVHLDGQQYIYEVREEKLLRPDAVNAALKHEEYPWLTLITCKTYNEYTDDYLYRTVVRAVLVDVIPE